MGVFLKLPGLLQDPGGWEMERGPKTRERKEPASGIGSGRKLKLLTGRSAYHTRDPRVPLACDR